MEMYNVSELGTADTYLIQSTRSNPQLASPPLEQFEAMHNEGVPEFVVEQGLYYPTATNYGYICTGFDSPGDWDDHHRIFGLDGQEIQYGGAQTENFPYVYYSPSYGYAQSPFNPYNPYIPGAMVGVDGSFLGSQQYYSIPSYENPVSSPAYFPMLIQSRPDIISNSTNDALLDATTFNSNRADGPGPKYNLSSASKTFIPNPAKPASNQAHSFTRMPEGPKANPGSSKQSATHGSVTSGSFSSLASSQFIQGSAQAVDNVLHGKDLSHRNLLKVSLPSSNGLSNFGSSAHGRATGDKVWSKFSYGRVQSNVNRSPVALTEQNRGPRTNKSKHHLAVKDYTTGAGNSGTQGNIIIYTDQFNKDNFHVDHLNAKFFVIKSYSEDDVHKSIKYNVWSSTPNGNKKLNSAYADAQKLAAGESKGCPVFLFFSVNASGHFCGVAEMTGLVDFHKDMDFWQQDKWSGSFPVKWHIVKDVPNPNFRHIILENNENKPVTNSRDTQEIRYKPGMEMLRIFKNYTMKTSLLDDFMYYENRQKIMQEEKTRLLVKSYGSAFLVPTLGPPRKLNQVVDSLSIEGEKIVEHNVMNSVKKTTASPAEYALLDSKVSDTNTAKANDNPTESDVKDDNSTLLKIGSLTINPKQNESKSLEAANFTATAITNRASSASSVAVMETKPINVVTVGSMPVKVNGFSESSGLLTVGTIPLYPRALQLDEAAGFIRSG